MDRGPNTSGYTGSAGKSSEALVLCPKAGGGGQGRFQFELVMLTSLCLRDLHLINVNCANVMESESNTSICNYDYLN